MKIEEGKEYILVTISEENDKLFDNLNCAKQYIQNYIDDDYKGYYETYDEYPIISIYEVKINKKLQ